MQNPLSFVTEQLQIEKGERYGASVYYVFKKRLYFCFQVKGKDPHRI
jgi:hypothetical protein